MTGQCCASGRESKGLARRLSNVTPSVVPGVLLLLLPKCPLCLAAWLTVATGLGVSATEAVWVRGGIVLLWIALLAAFVGSRLMAMRQHQ